MRIEQDPNFREHLMRPTTLEILLRGHLWIESQLIDLLNEALPYPERLNIDRLGFPVKVELAAANGFIRADDVPTFMKLNSLRNGMAHNLHRDLDEAAVNAMRNTFGEQLRNLYGSGDYTALLNPDEPAWFGQLRAIIACMCISLDAERANILKRKQEQRELNTRYKDLLEKLGAYRSEPPKR